MTRMTRDTYNPTLKLEVDQGRADSYNTAVDLVRRYAVQIDIGPDVSRSKMQQTIILTALNAARRAFPGGVFVRASEDFTFSAPWARGQNLKKILQRYGATSVRQLDPDKPTLVIGAPDVPSAGRVVVYAFADGWRAAALDRRVSTGTVHENELSGMLAGAFGVSECFQSVRGDICAGRRNVGASLWRPDLPWDSDDAIGPRIRYLPKGLWLLGLGHVGQACAWAIGCLPYPAGSPGHLYLQDFDRIDLANEATSLLSSSEEVGRYKTRVSASALEVLGFQTRVVERRYTRQQDRLSDEPDWALAAFDHRDARRDLYNGDFAGVVDIGLGATADTYLDMLLHTLPSHMTVDEMWPEQQVLGMKDTRLHLPAYQNDLDERQRMGEGEGVARCGVLEVAGKAVGAAFVGAAAASLGVAEVLRMLTDGPRYAVVSLDLRTPPPSCTPMRDAGATESRFGYVETQGSR